MEQQPTPSRSHFAHFNHQQTSELNGHNENGNDSIGNDNMRVTTGIVYRSAPNGHKVPQLSGSFVSVDMNGHSPPANVQTYIVQPDLDNPDGPNKIITASSQHGDGVVGKVTFNGVHIRQQQNGFLNNFQPQQHSFSLPDPQPSFKITVKPMDGPKPYDIEVKATDTLAELKKQICNVVPSVQQTLLFNGRQLVDRNDCKTLGDYGIKKDSEISTVLRLRGG